MSTQTIPRTLETENLIDYEDLGNNDWLAVNQFTIREGQHTRRPDVILFVNGLPLVVIELKNPADENATISSAFNQLQTYKRQIPSLFTYNALLVISDGLEARVGSLTSDSERFMPWRTIAGEDVAPASVPQVQVLIQGLFEKRRLLDYIRHFIVFEDDGHTLAKKIAGYHQFHAVNNAVQTTTQATSEGGDRRAGVVWHTQGSGKSFPSPLMNPRKWQCHAGLDIKLLQDSKESPRLCWMELIAGDY